MLKDKFISGELYSIETQYFVPPYNTKIISSVSMIHKHSIETHCFHLDKIVALYIQDIVDSDVDVYHVFLYKNECYIVHIDYAQKYWKVNHVVA